MVMNMHCALSSICGLSACFFFKTLAIADSENPIEAAFPVVTWSVVV